MQRKLYLLVGCVLLVIFFAASLLQAEAETKSWPTVPYHSVQLYLYNLEGKLANDHAILKAGRLDKTVVSPGVRLSAEQSKKLTQWIEGDISELIQGLSNCYIPHHGFVFFDDKEQAVAAMTICFYCQGVRFSPERQAKALQGEISPKREQELLKKLKELEEFVRSLGLPVFATPEEYKKYHD